MNVLLSAVPFLLFGTGIFYIIRLKGFYFLHPIRCLRVLGQRPQTKGISPFRALTVALAGTLGVGNIVGVASALYLGGAGAIFWMIISALVAMVLKYAEITLAMRHRRLESCETEIRHTGALSCDPPSGGAPYYMEDGLSARGYPRLGRCLAGVFASLCLINAVTMGGILQINAVAGAMESAFSVPPLFIGGGVAVLCVITVRGGAKRISALTEALVPLMTVAFLLACLAVIFLRRERLPNALESIWQDVWCPRSVSAGSGGFLLSRALRYGVMRGLVSNEAGCGTAPMAHVSADVERPAEQGVFGLLEVFVDTVLLCTVTALAILVSDSGPAAYGENAVLTAEAAFSSVLGDWAGGFFALAILLFGVATVLCWAHYGLVALRYLSRKKWTRTAFIAVFSTTLVVGALTTPAAAWTLADGAIAVMTILNLVVLLLMNQEVKTETEALFWPHKRKSKGIEWEGNDQ